MADFLPERASVYVEQEDKHMPELSVRETLDFAALCHGTGGRPGQFSRCGDLQCAPRMASVRQHLVKQPCPLRCPCLRLKEPHKGSLMDLRAATSG